MNPLKIIQIDSIMSQAKDMSPDLHFPKRVDLYEEPLEKNKEFDLYLF